MDHERDWSKARPGVLCWVSDVDEAYVPATVTAIDGNMITVKPEESSIEEIKVDVDAVGKPTKKGQPDPYKLLFRDDAEVNVDNMDNLRMLNAASILSNIRLRFRLDQIYTRTGPILIAMNPFKKLPIYGQSAMLRYHGHPYGELAPHPYQEAEDCIQQLAAKGESQCVVICGESGAGKTETTKIMLSYISRVLSGTLKGHGLDEEDESANVTEQSLGERMVDANPVLEAIGNAKTLRNNNSSRFGKFTLYQFNATNTAITGGRVENFLLEKARVSAQSTGERNYHIFYQLVAGASDSWKTQMSLTNPASFNYLNQSDCYDVDGIDDAAEFRETCRSLHAVEITDDEQYELFKLFAGCLHLGNVTFVPDGDAEASRVKDMAMLTTASALLGVNPQTMAQALVTTERELPGKKKVVSPQSPSFSEASRDSVAKFVFNALFDYVVQRINLAFDKESNVDAKFIGILDIFGFENLNPNGLDQLLINLANERLQKLFNDVTFKQEVALYNEEGIDFDKSDFPDNQPCLDLMTKRPHGLLLALDSACSRGNAASDEGFVHSCHKQYKAHQFYAACGRSTEWRNLDGSRTDDHQFVIKHFAGPIVYTVGSVPGGHQTSPWISKNLDRLMPHIRAELAQSNSSVMQTLFEQGDSGKKEARTIGGRFLASLNSLVKTLTDANSRFVRCIKTTPTRRPNIMDSPDVLRQLVCSGVIAALDVRHAGFPTRMLYEDFVREFHILATGVDIESKSQKREKAALLLTHPEVAPHIDQDKFRLGRRRIFLRAETGTFLQQLKRRLENPFALRLQRFMSGGKGALNEAKLRHLIVRFDELNELALESQLNESALDSALDEARETLKIAKASSGLNFVFDIAVARAGEQVEEAEEIFKEAKHVQEEARLVRAQFTQRLDALRSKLIRIDSEQGRFEVPTGNLAALWHEADSRLLHIRGKVQCQLDPEQDDPYSGMSLEDETASKEADLAVVLQAMEKVITKFNECADNQNKLELLRDKYSSTLAELNQELRSLSQSVSIEIREKPRIVSSIQHAESALESANNMLDGAAVDMFEATMRAGKTAILELSETIATEEFNHVEEQKRSKAKGIFAETKSRYSEIMTEVDAHMLRSMPAIAAAISQVDSAVNAAISGESGGADEYAQTVEQFRQLVTSFNSTYSSERVRVEQQRRERSAELTRLAPAVDVLHELITKLEVSSLDDEATMTRMIMDTSVECDNVKSHLEKTDNIAVAQQRVTAIIQDVAKAERAFNESLRRQEMLSQEHTAATKLLDSATRRMAALMQSIEHAGATAAQLVDERVADAEAMLADAQRAIRKGEQVTGLVGAVEAANERVGAAEDALFRIKQTVATTSRARGRALHQLEDARQLYNEVHMQAVDAGVLAAPDVSEAFLLADSTLRLAESRMEKPLTAQWFANGEMVGDTTAVQEAIGKVDQAESLFYAEKRRLEKVKRELRSGEAAVVVAQDKIEFLRQSFMEHNLITFYEVSSAVEEAEDALEHTSKMIATSQSVEVVHNAVAELNQKLLNAEERITEARLRKDTGTKLWREGQTSLDAVLVKLQSVVAMIDAVGPPVPALMEEVMFEATKAVNQSTRLLRQGKDVTSFQASVARAATMVEQAEIAANKVRIRVQHASKSMTSAVQRLDSLTRTLTQTIETADSKGVSRQSHIKSLLKAAEAMVQIARQRTEGGLQLWLDDPLTASRLVDEAVEKVQLAEEGVDEAVQLKVQMSRTRELSVRELEGLMDSFYRVRSVSERGGVAGLAVVKRKLASTEKEIEIARHALQSGNPVSFTASQDAIMEAERLISLETRRLEKRQLDIEFAKLELPTLQRKLAAVSTMVDAAGPPVGAMVGEVIGRATDSVKHIEDIVGLVRPGQESSGLSMDVSFVLPSLEDAIRDVADAEEFSVMTIQKINKVQAEMANETRQLDELQDRFTNLCESVATVCSKSDQLRIELEADWQDASWGDGEVKQAGGRTVQMIAEAIGTAEASLVDARRYIEVSIETYLESGAGVASKAIKFAAEKISEAQSLVDRENTKIEHEEREKSNAQARLETYVERLSAMRALAEVHKVQEAVSVVESVRAAGHALDVVAQLIAASNLSASPAAMEVAMRKVCVVQEVILAESQRLERVAAEKAHTMKLLEGIMKDFEAVKALVTTMGLKDVGFVGDSLAKAEKAIYAAETALTVAAQDPTKPPNVKEVQQAAQAVEDAERAVSQEMSFQEELSRLKLKRSLAPQLQMMRAAQRQGLKASAEQWQRRKMKEELDRATSFLITISEGVSDHRVSEKVDSATRAIQVAREQLTGASIRAAQAAAQRAISQVKAASTVAADVRFLQEGLQLS